MYFVQLRIAPKTPKPHKPLFKRFKIIKIKNSILLLQDRAFHNESF